MAAASYDLLAAEYYDPQLHPTSENFREASALFLRRELRMRRLRDAPALEVGAGRSLVAELYQELGEPLRCLWITDRSPRMLEHSTQFRDQGATVQVADARHLKLPSSRFALVFSSLGDSFNLRGFWREARRVLRPGGEILFSAPSFEWAEYYRAKYQESRYEAAMFETRSAGKAYVDSYVLPVEEQRKLIADAGLRPVAVQHVTLGELATARISPKLLSPQGASLRIVTGFVAVKSAP